MDNYNDRGIIKWLPFDGLVGFYDLIKDLRYRLNKKEKPILSEDKLFLMDLTIKEAINSNKELLIDYYEDGYLKQFISFINKVDLINRIIILSNNHKIVIDYIINLEII